MGWLEQIAIATNFGDPENLRKTLNVKGTTGFSSSDHLTLNQAFLSLFQKGKARHDLVSVFIEAGADVRTQDKSGNRPLAFCHDVRCAELLLQKGAEVNAVDGEGKGALQMAIRNGWGSVAKLLIKHGAQYHSGDLSSAAASCLDADLIALLIDLGCDVDERDTSGYTPLMRCAEAGIADLLIQNGADVNAVCDNERRQTVLMAAISRPVSDSRPGEYNRFARVVGRNADLGLISVLMNNGASVNAADASGRTPLMLCTYPNVAEMLIKNGANVNYVRYDEDNGRVSVLSEVLRSSESVARVLLRHGAQVCENDLVQLMTASRFPQNDLVDLLASAGASVNAKNELGMTPLMLCRKPEVAEALIAKGADVNQVTDGDPHVSALSLAIGRQCMTVAKVLLANGATSKPTDVLQVLCDGSGDDETLDLLISSCPQPGECVNMRDEHGKTLLMLCRSVATAQLLIRHGADVNAVTEDPQSLESNGGNSVLMDRIGQGLRSPTSLSIVQSLLDAGAEVNAANAGGKTAMSLVLRYALWYGLTTQLFQCFKLLIEHGAKLTEDSNPVLFECIGNNDLKAIQLLVSGGTGPACLDPKSTAIARNIPSSARAILSPCCLALLTSQVQLARYFRSISFLTISDVWQMPRTLKMYLRDSETLSFLDELLHSPSSLIQLSFIAVSTLLGPAPGRGERVKVIGIPPSMQRKLMFQDLEVTLTQAFGQE